MSSFYLGRFFFLGSEKISEHDHIKFKTINYSQGLNKEHHLVIWSFVISWRWEMYLFEYYIRNLLISEISNSNILLDQKQLTALSKMQLSFNRKRTSCKKLCNAFHISRRNDNIEINNITDDKFSLPER